MKYKLFFALFIFLGISLATKANHLVGGEFRISYVNNFTYDIQLHVYGDNATLGPGNEDAFVEASVFDKNTNRFIETLKLPLSGTAFVPYKNKACQNGSITTKILVYQLTKTLNPSLYQNQGGYYIVWERCCRNNGIVNIQDPGETGMVYYAEFPAIVKNNLPFINSTPVLPPMPPDFLCVGELYQYSMKATDNDGDQLFYTLSDPLAGHTGLPPNHLLPGISAPYKPVFWNSGFNTSNQIVGNPALSIDFNTGLLSVRPRFAGLFVFAITVSEYRNGLKIGEVRRDIQVKVNACPINASPVLTLREPGATRDYQPGDTLLVTDATDFCYDVKFSDPDVGQVLTLKAISRNFNGDINISPTTFTVTQANQVNTARICWPDCNINSPTQLYLVDLFVSDNACGSIASDTLQLTFRVIPKKNDKPTIKVVNIDPKRVIARIGQPLKFTIISTDTIDQDNLTVSLTGKGFDPADFGMQLSPLSGKSEVISTFSWIPDCAHLKQFSNYPLTFSVRDNSCYMDHETKLLVNLELEDVKDSVAFTAPNIFTPNNDNRNDFFSIASLPLDICDDAFQEIKIFSRWGTQVFRSDSRQFAWDGKQVSDGIYYYVVRFKKRKYKGWIEIVK